MKVSSRHLPFLLLGLVGAMVGASFAAVPLYDWFCRTTGYGGTAAVSAVVPDHVLDRMVRIRFDGSTDPRMPWEFKPTVPHMDVRIGEQALAFFEAYNPTDRTIAGTASYNVAPPVAGGFFTKIECFCFTEQVLRPGERVEMPVTFFVDPEIMDDPDGERIHAITLGYTFYETELPDEQAALDVPRQTDVARN